MKKLWVCMVVFGSMLGFGGATAHAQNGNPKLDVFLGYSFMTSGVADFNQSLNGYTVDIAANLNQHFGVEGNFSGYNGVLSLTNPGIGAVERQNQNDYYFLFGPKVQTSIGKVEIFSHFLVGPALLRFNDVNTSTELTVDTLRNTSFSAGVGGGADWNFAKGKFSWRILELDDLFTPTTGIDSRQLNNIRLETGLVIHL